MKSGRLPVRSALAVALLTCSTLAVAQEQKPTILLFPGANSRDTHFSVHNIREAQRTSTGKGVKVGILDHSFGIDAHKEMYAGGQSFQTDDWAANYATESHHGYWMATTLKEVAPDVEIYALGTYSSNEENRVAAMVKAIDWAIEHKLDVLTYSAQRFPPGLRASLDAAVSRAVKAGIVVAFIHYPHPENLLPTGLFPRSGDDEREPDVNILHYDYSVVFVEDYQNYVAGKPRRGYRPFLSISSTSPVTAGIVALMRSASPGLTPARCKEILMTTARPLVYEGAKAPRVVDAAAAVKAATASR
jgi:hypothetical protein